MQSSEIEDMLREAYSLADLDFGISEAVSAGQGYELPLPTMMRDLDDLVLCEGDLCCLAEKNFRERAPSRLNIERIHNSLHRLGVDGTPLASKLSETERVDFVRLCRLADEGIPLATYDEFTASTKPRKLRDLYVQVSECVNRSLYKLWEEFLVLMVPTIVLIHLAIVHFTPIGWTTKPGTFEGRQLFDAKDTRGGYPLNPTDKVAYTDYIRHEWGCIQNADLNEICTMILNFECDMRTSFGDDFSLADVILFKFDLCKAFHLLSFSPRSVRYLACELHQKVWPKFTPEMLVAFLALGITLTNDTKESWSLLYVTGSFGLIMLPFVFCVVTRCFLLLVQHGIYGRACSYVDDTMCVTLKKYLYHDLAAVCEIAEMLLGPFAMEWKKFYAGRIMVTLGWQINLETRRVTLSYRNYLKVVYGFFYCDTTSRVKVRMVNKLASWSARYTQILRALQPCTVCLYSQIAGMKNSEALMNWHDDARTAVLLWRSALLLLYMFEDTYSLPLDSFRVRFVSYDVEYDASLIGLGFLVFRLHNGQRQELIGCGHVRFPFDCQRDSSFQNSCEFIGLLLGVLTLAQLGIRNASLRLSGDSTTSLTWGVDGHFKGKLSQRAALIYILAALLFDNVATESIHIPGVDNVVCDDLSRLKVTATDLGIDYRLVVDLTEDTPLFQILELVNPVLPSPMLTSDTFRDFWNRAKSLILRIADDSSLTAVSAPLETV
jgi:hypothetical protein